LRKGFEKGTLIRRPSVNRETKTFSVPEEPTVEPGFASLKFVDLRSLDFDLWIGLFKGPYQTLIRIKAYGGEVLLLAPARLRRAQKTFGRPSACPTV
jgi:hypothetical protein